MTILGRNCGVANVDWGDNELGEIRRAKDSCLCVVCRLGGWAPCLVSIIGDPGGKYGPERLSQVRMMVMRPLDSIIFHDGTSSCNSKDEIASHTILGMEDRAIHITHTYCTYYKSVSVVHNNVNNNNWLSWQMSIRQHSINK